MKLQCYNRAVRAFTLVEVTGVVIILGLMATVVTVVATRSSDTSLDTQGRLSVRAFNDASSMLLAQGALQLGNLFTIVSNCPSAAFTGGAKYGGGNGTVYTLSSPAAPSYSSVSSVFTEIGTQVQTAGLGGLKSAFDSRQVKAHTFNLVFLSNPSGASVGIYMEVQ